MLTEPCFTPTTAVTASRWASLSFNSSRCTAGFYFGGSAMSHEDELWDVWTVSISNTSQAMWRHLIPTFEVFPDPGPVCFHGDPTPTRVLSSLSWSNVLFESWTWRKSADLWPPPQTGALREGSAVECRWGNRNPTELSSCSPPTHNKSLSSLDQRLWLRSSCARLRADRWDKAFFFLSRLYEVCSDYETPLE